MQQKCGRYCSLGSTSSIETTGFCGRNDKFFFGSSSCIRVRCFSIRASRRRQKWNAPHCSVSAGAIGPGSLAGGGQIDRSSGKDCDRETGRVDRVRPGQAIDAFGFEDGCCSPDRTLAAPYGLLWRAGQDAAWRRYDERRESHRVRDPCVPHTQFPMGRSQPSGADEDRKLCCGGREHCLSHSAAECRPMTVK